MAFKSLDDLYFSGVSMIQTAPFPQVKKRPRGAACLRLAGSRFRIVLDICGPLLEGRIQVSVALVSVWASEARSGRLAGCDS